MLARLPLASANPTRAGSSRRSAIKRRRGGIDRRFLAGLGLAATLTGFALGAWNQSSGDDDYRPYPVAVSTAAYRTASTNIDDVREQVLQKLGSSVSPTDIIVDPRANRLMVRGSAETHEAVAHVLTAIEDRANAANNRADSPADDRTGNRPTDNRAAPRTNEPSRDDARASAAPVARDADENTQLTRRIALRNIGVRDLQSALAALHAMPINDRRVAAGTLLFEAVDPRRGTLQIEVARDTGKITLDGPHALVDAWTKMIETIDAPEATQNKHLATKLVQLKKADPQDVRKTLAILEAATTGEERALNGGRSPRRDDRLVSVLLQPRTPARNVAQPGNATQPSNATQPNDPAERDDVAPARRGDQPAVPSNPRTGAQPGARDPRDEANPAEDDFSIRGPVRIEYIEALDQIIVIGNDHDVAVIMRVIRMLEAQTDQTRPAIRVVPMEHVNNEALAGFVTTIYDSVLAGRQGTVSITPLIKPNALLLIGREENVTAVVGLIKQLDVPVDPDSEVITIQLKHTSAFLAQRNLREFYGDKQNYTYNLRTGLGTKVNVVADYRTNSLIIQASPRDLVEIRRVIADMDVAESGSVNQLRVVKLTNSLAAELAPVIQQAISGPSQQPRITTQGGTGQNQQFQQAPQGNAGGGGAGSTGLQESQTLQVRQVMLQLLSVDSRGQRMISSGILNDVRITPDARGNALLVSAPAESMDLVVALIEQIDKLPPAEAQIKVFTIQSADAARLAETLQSLFGQATGGGGNNGQGNQFNNQQQNFRVQSIGDDGSVLVPLRIAVEQRTNSVIVSGSAGDLAVVQALLLRLDDPEARERRTSVHRLKNAPAQNIADAINQYIQGQRNLQQTQAGANLISSFEQFEREVIVVPEPVSNSLIVSATPRFFKEITDLVEKLDERPPMVMIQVLIAQVTLDNTDEFGVEFGLQDQILFDRSVGGIPGFNFNNQPLGNNTATPNSNTVGSQGLSNFAVGRNNSELGFGGLVLSASSESVNVLIRALQESRRLDVLSRPQVMTLDNQQAFIQVGARVPLINSVQNPGNTTAGTTFGIQQENVGIILGVTPRISPDGLVVMEIDAEKSEVGPIAEGIPISIAPNGDVIRSPQINTTTAQTTVMAASGQTVVLGGLITKTDSIIHRQVPWLGDLPVLGRLFSFDSEFQERTELLIIMTPHIVRSEQDNEWVKQVEAARMSWCLADIYKIHGTPKGLGLVSGEEIPVIRPDENPTAPELVPAEQDKKVEEIHTGPAPNANTPGAINNAAPRVVPPSVNTPRPANPRPVVPPPSAPIPMEESRLVPPAQAGGVRPAQFEAPGDFHAGQYRQVPAEGQRAYYRDDLLDARGNEMQSNRDRYAN